MPEERRNRRQYPRIPNDYALFVRKIDNGAAGVTAKTSQLGLGGCMFSSDLNLADGPFLVYIHQIDAYLKSVGASDDYDSEKEWPNDPPNCKDGDVKPIVPDTLTNNHNGNSSLYNKMQGYLVYGNFHTHVGIYLHEDL